LNCASTGTAELVTPSKIQLNTEVKNASCFGFANGTATVLATGSINQFTYKWDSAAVGQTTQRALNLKAGNYTVTVTDTAGCTGATTLLITQPSALRINNTRITPNRCVGDLEGGIQLQIIGGTPKYSLKWSNGDSSATISRLRAGTYTISIDDLNGCKLTDSVVLRQPNGITAQVIPKAVKCYGSLDGSITMNASGGTPPYKYSTDDVIYNGINQLVGLKAGDHPIFILDNNNCKWFDRVTVPTPAKLTVDAGQDRTIQLGDSTRLSADIQNARGRVTFTWKAPYDSTLSCKICPAPMSKPLFTIQYEVTARDSAGCLATDDLKVSVEKPRLVVIPTGFSPNDDNVNDILYVHGREGVKIKVFKIYDRWGEMVFAATDFKPNDPAFGWDGKFHGDPMNTGIFVWYIEVQYLDGATDAFKGNCTLLR
jgi:gliding motility-associated-like protein